MSTDEAAVLTILVNAGIAFDDNYSALTRLKALSIALDTAIEVQMSFLSVLSPPAPQS